MGTMIRAIETIVNTVEESHRILDQVRGHTMRIHDAAALVEASLRAGGTLFTCGNGGSAGDAQHIAAELSGRFLFDRPPLSAQALTTNTSAVTAIANDYGYDEVFARQLQGAGRAGDVLLAISTSGRSPNVRRAAEVAKEMGIVVIALTGKRGPLSSLADVAFNFDASTPRIQEAHILVGHTICQIVEEGMFG